MAIVLPKRKKESSSPDIQNRKRQKLQSSVHIHTIATTHQMPSTANADSNIVKWTQQALQNQGLNYLQGQIHHAIKHIDVAPENAQIHIWGHFSKEQVSDIWNKACQDASSSEQMKKIHYHPFSEVSGLLDRFDKLVDYEKETTPSRSRDLKSHLEDVEACDRSLKDISNIAFANETGKTMICHLFKAGSETASQWTQGQEEDEKVLNQYLDWDQMASINKQRQDSPKPKPYEVPDGAVFGMNVNQYENGADVENDIVKVKPYQIGDNLLESPLAQVIAGIPSGITFSSEDYENSDDEEDKKTNQAYQTAMHLMASRKHLPHQDGQESVLDSEDDADRTTYLGGLEVTDKVTAFQPFLKELLSEIKKEIPQEKQESMRQGVNGLYNNMILGQKNAIDGACFQTWREFPEEVHNIRLSDIYCNPDEHRLETPTEYALGWAKPLEKTEDGTTLMDWDITIQKKHKPFVDALLDVMLSQLDKQTEKLPLAGKAYAEHPDYKDAKQNFEMLFRKFSDKVTVTQGA